MSHILALDQGTSSSRAIVYDPEGRAVATGRAEHEQFFPRPGWVEHDPEEIWATQSAAAAQAMRSAKLGSCDLLALGLTNQRETAIAWRRSTGESLHNAIVWQDRRTAPHCERLRADGLSAIFRERTGLVIDAYFSATKFVWLLENVDAVRAAANDDDLCLGTIDAWLIFKMTGGKIFATDETNASRTLLYNIQRNDWDDELLEIFGVPREALPEVRPSSTLFGETAAPEVLRGVPIAGVAGDQQASLFAHAGIDVSIAKNTYGTGCFLLANIGETSVQSEHGLITTLACRTGGTRQYAMEGSVLVAGAAIQWLRDGLGLIESPSDIEALASQVDSAGGVMFVPAFAGLGAPHWDPHARAAILGLTRGATDAHIARAALEGIAHTIADLQAALRADGAREIEELRVDGGPAANDLLMQFQADLLQIPIVRPRDLETTALGAAALAGIQIGVWSSIEDIAHGRAVERRFEPAMPPEQAAQLRERWADAVSRCRGWAREEDAAAPERE